MTLIALALCGLGFVACGDTGDGPQQTASQGSRAAVAAERHSPVSTGTLAGGHFKGDEEDDDTPANRTTDTKNDYDGDFDNDKLVAKGYFDGDDGRIRYFGHPANREDARALIALVERYYAAAAADDGAAACLLLNSRSVSGARVEDYRGVRGEIHVKGNTCAEGMSGLFAYYHDQLIIPTRIVDIRVSGKNASVLLASTSLPASEVPARYEGGTWRINGILDHVFI